jgi:cytochrome P450
MMAGAPQSAFSTVSHDVHRMRRAALSPFFSKKRITDLSPRITAKVSILCNLLAKRIGTTEVVDINTPFMALTSDIIMEYCYGKDLGFLQEPDFKQQWKDSMTTMFENAAFRRSVPWLTYLLQKLPNAYILKLMPSMEILINWQNDIKGQVETILLNKQETGNTQEEKEADSIFCALRDNEELPAAEKSVQRLADEGEVLIAAASETTAKTLTWTAFYIIDTPGVLEKLREELKSVMKSSTDEPSLTELEKLPYLVTYRR